MNAITDQPALVQPLTANCLKTKHFLPDFASFTVLRAMLPDGPAEMMKDSHDGLEDIHAGYENRRSDR
jgi:hypothetical protein